MTSRAWARKTSGDWLSGVTRYTAEYFGSQRRGDRITTGKRGGHLQRRRRTQRWIFLNTTIDHFLNYWIEILDDRGGVCRRRVAAPQLDHVIERGRFKRPLAGEEFIKDQTQRVDIAPDC